MTLYLSYRCALSGVTSVSEISEQKGDTPEACYKYETIDDTAENCALTAEEPSHQVKAEKTHAAPVDAADNGQHQGNTIHEHVKNSSHLVSLIFCPVGKKICIQSNYIKKNNTA